MQMNDSNESSTTPNQLVQALGKAKDKPDKPQKRVEGAFPVGSKVRFVGNQHRLFAGYQGQPILEPGSEYVVSETSGTFSVIHVDVSGVKYEIVITNASKSNWVLVP